MAENSQRWVRAVLGAFLALTTLAAVVLPRLADGETDPYYLRFTTPQQRSLIIGTSRAAQGILPAVLNDGTLKFDGPLYNFAFTNSTARPGPWYYGTVRKKLRRDSAAGLFLVEANPLAFTHNPSDGSDSPENFIERNNFVAKMKDVTSKPNYEYLWNHYAERYYQLVLGKFTRSKMLVHDDGWLEVRVAERKGAVLRQKTEEKVATTRAEFTVARLSPSRVQAFAELVKELGAHGQVVAVRVPMSPALFALESEFFPDFDRDVRAALSGSKAKYLSFAAESGQYATNDGTHLHRAGARRFSERLRDELQKELR